MATGSFSICYAAESKRHGVKLLAWIGPMHYSRLTLALYCPTALRQSSYWRAYTAVSPNMPLGQTIVRAHTWRTTCYGRRKRRKTEEVLSRRSAYRADGFGLVICTLWRPPLTYTVDSLHVGFVVAYNVRRHVTGPVMFPLDYGVGRFRSVDLQYI